MEPKRFFDPFLYDYYDYLKLFRRHGLEKDFISFLESVDWAIEAFSEYRLPRWVKDIYISDVQEKASNLKNKCDGNSNLVEVVTEVERYFHGEVKKLEEYDSWRWRLLRRLKRLLEKLSKPYKIYRRFEGSISSFITSTSIEFASRISSRFKGSRIVYYLSYGFMDALLSLAVTAPSSILTAMILTYFYAYFLANHLLASNVYATHHLLFEVRVWRC